MEDYHAAKMKEEMLDLMSRQPIEIVNSNSLSQLSFADFVELRSYLSVESIRFRTTSEFASNPNDGHDTYMGILKMIATIESELKNRIKQLTGLEL